MVTAWLMAGNGVGPSSVAGVAMNHSPLDVYRLACEVWQHVLLAECRWSSCTDHMMQLSCTCDMPAAACNQVNSRAALCMHGIYTGAIPTISGMHLTQVPQQSHAMHMRPVSRVRQLSPFSCWQSPNHASARLCHSYSCSATELQHRQPYVMRQLLWQPPNKLIPPCPQVSR
jgi:hypothetical protein